MGFSLCYAEAQVDVKCRLPPGVDLEGLLESNAVKSNVLFLKRIVGLENEEWDCRFVPDYGRKMKARSWCGLNGSSIVFYPSKATSKKVFEDAALYRQLPAALQVKILESAPPVKVEEVWKGVQSSLGFQKNVETEGMDDLEFWVIYAEAWKDVTVDPPEECHMRDLYKIPAAVQATKELLRELQIEEERVHEMLMRFVPELAQYDGGPSAIQWTKFKPATIFFCEDPDIENELQEGSLYKQAALYRRSLLQTSAEGKMTETKKVRRKKKMKESR